MFTLNRLVFLASIVWLAACQTAQPLKRSQSAAEPDSLAAPSFVAQVEVPYETSPIVMENTLSELIAGNNAFAFELYRTIRNKEAGNLFYSPYSISITLAMTYAGSRSTTAQQMAGTLHFTLPQEQLHPAFNALDFQLAPGNRNEQETDEANFNLQIANSIWGQSGHAFRPEYLDLIARHYGSELRLVDFTILQALSPKAMNLFVPKFEYDASLHLAETLAELGMPDAFNPDRADFSGMDGTHSLFIKHVIHKAFVAVDEIATEAAAATGVVAGMASEPAVIKVDRPFVFVIRDSQSGAILFIGRMVNPATYKRSCHLSLDT